MHNIENLEFPSEIMIEVTNNCNCKCFFCASTESQRKRGYIEPEIAECIMKKAYAYGARKLSFHGMGEPFLCKELERYVGQAKKIGYKYIYLDSNGILATPDKAFPVLDAGLDSLKFSIHAATAQTHKRITGVNGFEKVLENLKSIHEYKNKNHLACKLIAYQAISTLNQKEVEAFRELMGQFVDEVWTMPIHNGSGVKLGNKLFSTTEETVAVRELPCAELYQRMIVTWEGNAIACSTDWTGALVYGDAKEEDLLDLWNSNAIWSIRKQHQNRNTLPAICAKCMTVI